MLGRSTAMSKTHSKMGLMDKRLMGIANYMDHLVREFELVTPDTLEQSEALNELRKQLMDTYSSVQDARTSLNAALRSETKNRRLSKGMPL